MTTKPSQAKTPTLIKLCRLIYCILRALAIGPSLAICTLSASAQDTLALREVQVVGSPLPTLRTRVASLSARAIDIMPRRMGAKDPLKLLALLSGAATTGELTNGMMVQGCGASLNRYEIDGAGVVNPEHMLGLYSAFNGPHFAATALAPNGHLASQSNFIGALITARTPSQPDTAVWVEAAAGFIEAHASASFPLTSRSSLRLSARRSYLDLLFPGALHIDHGQLRYNFDDFNTTFISQMGSVGTLRVNGFYSSDRLGLHDDLYDTDGHFAWHNAMGAVSLEPAKWGAGAHSINLSSYGATFDISQAAIRASLPSSLTQLSYRGDWHHKGWSFGVEGLVRWTREQYNKEATARPPWRKSLEASVYGSYRLVFRKLAAEIGFRATSYTDCRGYRRFYPLPRLNLRLPLTAGIVAEASFSLLVQTLHMVKESATGLPSDFWTPATRLLSPTTARSFSLGLNAPLSWNMSLRVDAYYRSLSNVTEYVGSMFNMLNHDYRPLDDALSGTGRAMGIGLTLMHASEHVQGWLSYTLGRSETYIAALAACYFPSIHDRRHDLKAVVSYTPRAGWRFGLTAVYATGTPYTAAKFGYMIGENFIWEYYPRNSSRLPSYCRVDIGAEWTFYHGGALQQRLGVGIYNVLCTRNILFTYPSYTAKEGLRQVESSLQIPIPSLTYTIIFGS